MKKLYLIRHAKSDWSAPTISDFDRGLNKRGKKAIPTMGKALREKNIKPDLIISSEAKRAKLTAQGVAEELKYDRSIKFLEELYFCEPEDWIEILRKVDDKYNTQFMVGHNPEITELAEMLTNEYIENVPTLGIIGLHINIKKWSDFTTAKTKKKFFIYPKMFK